MVTEHWMTGLKVFRNVRSVVVFTLNREDFSFVIHLDRQPRTSRRREAQTGSRARSGSRSERTLDAVEHSRTLMEWWPFLIFHRGGLRIKVINNTRGQVLIFLSNLRMVPRARLSCWFLRRAFGEELVSKFLDSPDCENIHPYAAPFTRCGQQDCEREFYRGLLGKEVRNDFRPTFEFSEGALE